MITPVKILVVEETEINADNTAQQLTDMGYEVTAALTRGDEALIHARENRPDLVLLDIPLRGALDGIATAQILQGLWNLPVIFVTAITEEAAFERAKDSRPYAFITKPINPLNLLRVIDLTASLHKEYPPLLVPRRLSPNPNPHLILNDRLFVRSKDRMVRVSLGDILYLEADRNYCHLVTTGARYTLSTSLKSLRDKLPPEQFLRVHRSYIVNLLQEDEVAEHHLVVSGHLIALAHDFRQELLKRITVI